MAGAAVAGAAFVAAVPPNGQIFYPKCAFHSVTGLWCPLCGSTRAVHSLLTGDIARAVHDNVVIVAALPIVLTIWALWATGRPIKVRWSQPVTIALAILLVAFGIARNLPWAPFRALAPLASVHG